MGLEFIVKLLFNSINDSGFEEGFEDFVLAKVRPQSKLNQTPDWHLVVLLLNRQIILFGNKVDKYKYRKDYIFVIKSTLP